ncbi:PREDICTED: uncharacterized protein LOC104748689 [Camelina sativa]|uniref:Uncharacterized protein LOC104748689 n=1 Tax=Camelina sativa TaxID=90675 RepID=A0ABM0WBG2_CAMSA|nr:PREDICTED: uncharacterized protein LOC104748689 [Camelina sativa]
MVQSSKLHGLPMEDPLDHLDQFDMLCGTVKINGISEDAFKLRLFPFSLGDRARTWEKNLPVGSITSWDQCKRAFLSKFFSTTRTARGVLPKIRMLLDTASNGNFLGQDVDVGMTLVENLAQSDGNYGEDYDRTPRDHSDMNEQHRKEIKALNGKMDKMLMANQKQVHFVNECELYQEGMEACVEGQEEVNYIGGQGYNKLNPNYHNHPNLSYRSTNVENPQDQSYPPQKPPGFPPQPNYQPQPQGNYQAKPQSYSQPQQQMNAPHPHSQVDDTNALLRQLLEGQGRGAIELATQMKAIHNKVDNVYGELNAKFERLQTQVQGQASSSSTKQMGSLPGKSEQHPKAFCNAIFKEEVNRVTSMSFEKSKMDSHADENERSIEKISALLYGSAAESLVVAKVEKTEKESRGKEIVANEVEKKDEPSVALPLYSPPIPFPQRVLTKVKKKVLSSFKANMNRVGTPLPHVDSLSQVPSHIGFIKAILANREKVEEIMGIFDSPSEEQPRASVNVMSLEMVKSLGIKDMKQPSSSITLEMPPQNLHLV